MLTLRDRQRRVLFAFFPCKFGYIIIFRFIKTQRGFDVLVGYRVNVLRTAICLRDITSAPMYYVVLAFLLPLSTPPSTKYRTIIFATLWSRAPQVIIENVVKTTASATHEIHRIP